jgi:hypothetical protein
MCPSEIRGRRECRVLQPPPTAPRAIEKEHTSLVTTGEAVSPAFPAQWFYGFLRDLPGVRDFLVTVIGAMQSIVANLTPAKGRQDHTTSPSARNIARQSMCCVHRIPHPNVRDDAYAPLSGNGMARACRDDLPDEHSEIFFVEGLDRPNQFELPEEFCCFAQPVGMGVIRRDYRAPEYPVTSSHLRCRPKASRGRVRAN